MKKTRLLAAVAALTMCLAFVLAGCSQGASTTANNSNAASTSDPVNVRVASLKGPTSIGMVSFMSKASSGETSNTYDFQICGTADEILPSLIQGNIDIALIPANAASTVYNKTNGGVQVIDINTLGVLYVVSGDSSISSISDLAGKTVVMTGKGTTPEYVMNYLLSQAGIADQVTLEYKSEATEVAAVLNADPDAIGVLPEPYVTAVTMKNSSLASRISLTDAWNTLQGNASAGTGSKLVTGVTVVRTEFASAHPEAVAEFLKMQQASVEAVNADPTAAGELVVSNGIMESAAAAAKAIPSCNLVCISGDEMKSALSGYLQVLFGQDPSSVGGALPGDDFYRVAL